MRLASCDPRLARGRSKRLLARRRSFDWKALFLAPQGARRKPQDLNQLAPASAQKLMTTHLLAGQWGKLLVGRHVLLEVVGYL